MDRPASATSRILDRRRTSGESLFRSLFLAYPDSMLVVDEKGDIVLANPAAAALLGYSMEELRSLNVDALVPDSVRPSHEAHRESYGRAPHARPMGLKMDLQAKRKDGTTVRVEIALSPLQPHGMPFVVAAIRDIGDYPRVKQALQRALYSEQLALFGRLSVDEREMQRFLAHAPEVVVTALQVESAILALVDSGTRVLTISGVAGPLAVQNIGERVADQGKSLVSRVLAERRPIAVSNRAEEAQMLGSAVARRGDLVSALAVPLFDRGKIVGVLEVRSTLANRFGDDEMRFMESIANLVATTLQRARSEDALNHAQRLESVGQLTGGIAHDFNNLLTVVQGNLQILEELPDLAQNALAKEMLAAALRAAKRGAELTGKLLAFSRRQVLQSSVVDIRVMLYSLSDMLHRTLDQRIRIDIEVPPLRLLVLADAGQLESALLNIALNSRDAMPNGGTLRFRANVCDTLPSAALEALDDPTQAAEHYVELVITDNGSGMSTEVKARAFEPFYTTKAVGRGTGLGLSTVYGYIKQSKGSITIESEPGVGTEIALYIPRLLNSDVEALGNEPEQAQVPPGMKVLLVEDDAAVCEVVHAFLIGLGCAVEAVDSAEKALEQIAHTPFDLLVSDVALGAGMRGTELSELARSRAPALPVLLMSGYSSELLDIDAGASASQDLLRKPFTQAALGRAITKLLAARTAN